jgi:replicative DNA helicase
MMPASHFPLTSCNEMLEDLDALLAAQQPPCSTGIAPLDEVLNGGLNDELIVIGGVPGAGKTDLAINITAAIAQLRPVIYVSFELSKKQLFLRLLSCTAAKADSTRALTEQQIRNSPTNAELTQRLAWTANNLYSIGNNIMFADAAAQAIEVEKFLTVEDLRAVVAAQKAKTGVAPAVAIDYLQEFTAGNDHGTTSTDTLDYLARHLAAMAHIDETPVIVLSSMAKDGSFRGSAHISHAADIALVIKPSASNSALMASKPIDVEVAKNRSGRSGMTIQLTYTPELHLFS